MIDWNTFNTAGKIRIARALYRVVASTRRLTGQSLSPQIRRRGVTFELDLAEGIDLGIYLFGAFEYQTYRALQRLIHPGATVIDVGANFGVHTLPIARLVGDTGRVIAFEPTTAAFDRMIRNIALNPDLSPRITPVKGYLSDGEAHDDTTSFYASWRLDHGTNQHPKHFGTLSSADDARGLTLDAYVNAEGLERLDVMKLDVDGYECRVLRGAAATIERFRPAIVLEVCPYALEEHGDSARLLLDLLRARGYRFLDEHLRPIDEGRASIESRIKPGGSINIVAMRAGSGAGVGSAQGSRRPGS